MTLAWHFLPLDRRLRYGDGRLAAVGETITHEGPLALCTSGLHASVMALDALTYAPGPVACRVRLDGEIIKGDDKLVAQSRTVLAMTDATPALKEFSRWCALRVAHLWNCPPVVREFLETGSPGLREEAERTAEAEARATKAAARAAAWAAARAAKAAEWAKAAWAEAAWVEATAAWAETAAEAAAAEVAAQNEHLENLLFTLFKEIQS